MIQIMRMCCIVPLQPLVLALWTLLLLSTPRLSLAQKSAIRHPNVLYLMTDQQRFDALRRVQDELPWYAGKHKIRTPNLDRLSKEGAFMKTAYSPCPVCGPARTSIRTGCTIERTGVQTNPSKHIPSTWNPVLFLNKIKRLEGLDQILVEDYGYVSEYYGKFHIPDSLYMNRKGSARVVQYNDYNFSSSQPMFQKVEWKDILTRYLNSMVKSGVIKNVLMQGQQIDSYSSMPYTPISLDSRFGKRTNTSIRTMDSFDAQEDSLIGNYTWDKKFSSSFVNHDIALRALDRLAKQSKPFILTVSYHHPHPPYMAPFQYLDYYWKQRSKLYTPPNVLLADSSSYFEETQLRQLNGAGYCNKTKIQDLTAVYYSMVEEIDSLVGIMLSRLDTLGLTNSTLVVFMSDHGEMLGSHCMRGKNIFLEDSVRVPLIMKLPGAIKPGTIVDEPVSLLDTFSTILDYVGASKSDKSDGSSFRPFINGTSINNLYDETSVISEWDYRSATTNSTLTKSQFRPNFMVRHGNMKLFIHKKADSTRLDSLYDLTKDPFEMNNLIDRERRPPSNAIVGKAEHLRYLLIDWMKRMEMSGNNDFYSNPIYNANEGEGDISEVLRRQTWSRQDIWVSDTSLVFRRAWKEESSYVGNEWLFMGRRTSGTLLISKLRVVGTHSSMFHLSATKAKIDALGVFRLKVTFKSKVLLQAVDASLEIVHNAGKAIYVPLVVDIE